jgi:hypothetical protein
MRFNISLMLTAGFLASVMLSPVVSAYGGGSSSKSCAEASFYKEAPTRNSTVTSLGEFSIIASDNTVLSTLDVQINGEKVVPVVTPQRAGDSLITVKLEKPLTQASKARITLRAKSLEGCETFEPIYIEIKP